MSSRAHRPASRKSRLSENKASKVCELFHSLFGESYFVDQKRSQKVTLNLSHEYISKWHCCCLASLRADFTCHCE